MNEILIFLLSLAGAFVLRVCGFGFGVFTMAWLPYLLPSYGEATTLSGILAMAGSILVAFKNWRKIDWYNWAEALYCAIINEHGDYGYNLSLSEKTIQTGREQAKLMGIRLRTLLSPNVY